jgi:threonine aldolase
VAITPRIRMINLYSDTQTRPTAAMRAAMAAAEVGD